MHLTEGYELITAITNAMIFIISIYCFINLKKEKLWKFFYLCLIFDSFLGVIVHGIQMSTNLNNILWAILATIFTITINNFFGIFLKFKLKHILTLSILLTILLLVMLIFDMNFILTFVLYVLLTMIISFYYIFKDNIKNKWYYIIGFIVQLIGGILMLMKLKCGPIDHNGICHLFTCATLIILFVAIKKK